MVHHHDGPYFTASILKIRADRSADSSYNLFQAKIGNVNVTTITGHRQLQHHGHVVVTDGTVAVISKNGADQGYKVDVNGNAVTQRASVQTNVSS